MPYDISIRLHNRNDRHLLRRLVSLLAVGAFAWLSAACDAGIRDCQQPSDCFGGELCIAGQCTPSAPLPDVEGIDSGCRGAPCQPCEPGFHRCGDTCVDDTSVDTCGSRCEACPAGTQEGFEATCEPGGTCGLVCVGPDCPECEQNGDCTDDPDRKVCDDGTCVQCTDDARAACGPHSCDPANNTCTGTSLYSRRNCETCLINDECEDESSRCVPMYFKDDPLPDRYCLPLKFGRPCNPPYSAVVQRTDVSGQLNKKYCAPEEQLTTCEAVLFQGRQCIQSSQCGLQGYEDGICLSRRCTYQCNQHEECINGKHCLASACTPI